MLTACLWSIALHGQVVTSVNNTFNSIDTVTNFISHPSFNPIGIRCPWNYGTPCYAPSNGQVINCYTASNTPVIFMPGRIGPNLGPGEVVLLDSLPSAIGFNQGFGFSSLIGARAISSNGTWANTWILDETVWKQPSDYVTVDYRVSVCDSFLDSSTFSIHSLFNPQIDTVIGPFDFSDTTVIQRLTLDFVSTGTFFDMEYVFASDAFDSLIVPTLNQFPAPWNIVFWDSNDVRICSTANDRMALFLSGPGINGPYHNKSENIALLPGTNLPVTASNIRPNSYSGGNCGVPPMPSIFRANDKGLINFPFNGYTAPLEVKKIPINPCDTYSLEIVLGEAGLTGANSTTPTSFYNNSYSYQYGASALIIKKQSARTGFWYPAPLQLYDGLGVDTLVEGCPGMLLKLVRFTNINQADSIGLEYFGSAVSGLDLDSLPEFVYFQPGQDTTTLLINASADNINEGVESIGIRLLPPGEFPCPVDTTELEFFIADRPSFGASIADTFHFNPCLDSALTLAPDSIWGLEPYTLVWSTGDTLDDLVIIPDSSFQLSLTIFDACFQDSVVLPFFINYEYDRLNLSTYDINSGRCPGFSFSLDPLVTGGYLPYTYLWEGGFSDTAISVQPTESSTYALTLTDACGLDTLVDSFVVDIPLKDPLRILGQERYAFPCTLATVNISAGAYLGQGGYGDVQSQSAYRFSWDNWNTLGQRLSVSTTQDSTILLAMTDTCGVDTTSLPVRIDVFEGPFLAVSLPDTLHACIGEPYALAPIVEHGVNPYSYRWSTGENDSTLSLTPELAKQDLSVTVTDACGFRESAMVSLYATRPMAAFDATNDTYQPLLIRFENQSQDAIRYRWYFGDGFESEEQDPEHLYTELEPWEITLIATDTFGCSDEITSDLDIPLNLFVPNAFTPNGDGQNEVWQPLGYGFQSLGYIIYDRWGQEIFRRSERSDQILPWDGTVNGNPLPSGTYSYIIIVQPFKGLKEEIMGSLNLVR
jgi:gliding motility-associated-like protein